MTQASLFELAIEGPTLLKEKNEVQHFSLACKSILNYCDTDRMPDTYTINPYRGCEFGCAYCYARYTHEFLERSWEDFEKKIFVKRDASRVLLRTLDQKKLRGKHIAIGTATDPYQPAEAKFRLTQHLLEVLAQAKGLSVSITTKSALVKRDISLFQKISQKNEFQINISLISFDEDLLRRLEPKASRPAARLTALKEITAAGVRAGVFIMPILPTLTDSWRNLEAVVRTARENGAHYVGNNVLFLRESAKTVFLDFLRRERPELLRQYRGIYGNRTYSPRWYRAKIEGRLQNLKKKYGFSQ